MIASKNIEYMFHNILNRTAYVYGIESHNQKFRFSVRTLLTASILFVYIFGEFYTIATMPDDIVLKSLSTFAPWLECLYKFYMFYTERHVPHVKTEYLHEFYVQCERNTVASRICNRWARRFRFLFKTYFIVLTCSSCLVQLWPIVGYLRTHEWDVPVVATALPGIDYQTTAGYRLMYAINSITIPIAWLGMCCADATVFLLMLHVCPMSDVFVCKLEELERNLVASDGDQMRASEEAHRHFLNIARLHREISLYIKDMSNWLYMMFFIVVLLEGISMCIGVFVLTSLHWSPLMGLLAAYMTKLLVTCTMGTLVQIYVSGVRGLDCDRMLDGLLRFKWYLLCKADQRIYMYMVHRAQTERVLSAGTMPLNMELFVSVIKNTYSFAMFLMQTLA